jgi:hypothetical protein
LCPDATSPAQINTTTSIKCDGKCQFTYSLKGVDAITASNPGTYLSFELTSAGNAIASFNSAKYEPKLLQLYSPSLHEYDNQRADAESILVLESQQGGTLYICTPLEKGSRSGPVDALINTATSGPTSESRITIGSGKIAIREKLDANALCIDGKFFTYSGTGLGTKDAGCVENASYIVYAPPHKVSLSGASLRELRTAIDDSRCEHPIVDNQSVVVNLDGPGGSIAGGDIYIKCEPTGNSVETKDVAFSTVNVFDPANLSDVWGIITGVFAMILMWGLWKAFEKLMSAALGPVSMKPGVPQSSS